MRTAEEADKNGDAQLASKIVLILGLANLFADGFSMATGSFLSTKSEQEYYDRERQREAWEFEHFPDGEREELFSIYRERGYSEEEARHLTDIQTRDSERAVRTMMVDELLSVPTVAVIVAVPTPMVDTNPFSSTVATAGSDELQTTPTVTGLVVESVKLPETFNCC